MKYEALYAAVLGAAPTVLIGFVLEIRFEITRLKSLPPRQIRWWMHFIVICTALSAIMSAYGLYETKPGFFQESAIYAYSVFLTLMLGIAGLTAFLLLSYVDVRSKPREPR